MYFERNLGKQGSDAAVIFFLLQHSGSVFLFEEVGCQLERENEREQQAGIYG